MYLNAIQPSPVFQGTIKVKKAEIIKKGNITEVINDLAIDTKEIRLVNSVCVNANAFARELGLPNREHVLYSFKKSVDKTCSEISLVTLWNDVKYRIAVTKDKFMEAYNSVLNTDSEIIL